MQLTPRAIANPRLTIYAAGSITAWSVVFLLFMVTHIKRTEYFITTDLLLCALTAVGVVAPYGAFSLYAFQPDDTDGIVI